MNPKNHTIITKYNTEYTFMTSHCKQAGAWFNVPKHDFAVIWASNKKRPFFVKHHTAHALWMVCIERFNTTAGLYVPEFDCAILWATSQMTRATKWNSIHPVCVSA